MMRSRTNADTVRSRRTQDETGGRRLRRRLGIGALVVLGALIIAPASAGATPKFGAYLAGDPDPVDVPEWCPGGAGEKCTRMAINYEDPPHAGPTPFAPENGVIDKIKVVSETAGSFRLQLAKYQGLPTVNMEARVRANGPKISYEGTGSIETFNVDVPVKRFQWLAIRTKFAGTLQCSAGIDGEAIFQPPLTVDGPFTPVDYYSGCTHLIQAVME
jgi:hypothetical protein